MQLNLKENYGYNRTKQGIVPSYRGEIEFEIKDVHGRIIETIRQQNLIKIFAKEILSHRIPYSKVWDPTAGAGAGAWVVNNLNLDEFAAKYIVFGASFDANGNPLDTADERYYTLDPVTGKFVPISLGVGAEFDGGLINPIPISEPNRPLKRIEKIYFGPTYQPAGTPLLQADVRAINNILYLETTLQQNEYNGFGVTSSDFFTITEVALVGAAEIGSVGACECDPRDIFLTGDNGHAMLAHANGTATVNLDPSEPLVDLIKEGDQIKIVVANTTSTSESILNQISPYYLVVSKFLGGRDIVLDRTPVDANNAALEGNVGLLRDGFRIFSHRVTDVPVRKSSNNVITVRWKIILN